MSILLFILIFYIFSTKIFIEKFYSFNKFYSFKIKNKFVKNIQKPIVFLHIPKNAGSSIKRHFNDLILPQHHNSLPSNNEINIAIIRNPYSRLQSIFAHIKLRDSYNKDSHDLNQFPTLHDLALAYFDKKNFHHHKAHKLLDWDPHKFFLYHKLENSKTGSCINSKNLPCIHWAPQYLYVDGHNATVDHFLLFENLDYGIRQLQAKNIINIKKKNFFYKIHNKTPPQFKKLATLTPLSKKLANHVYKKDFQLWYKVSKQNY